MKKEEIITNIESLVSTPGFVYAFTIMLCHDLFYNPEEAMDINWRERLNHNEFSFLAGLMVKNEIDLSIPSEEKVKQYIERTYELFEELHQAYLVPMNSTMKKVFQGTRSPEKFNEDFNMIFQSGEVAAEPIFYSGSGAYEFQYLEFAAKRYLKDAAWIQKNKGLDIIKAIAATKELKIFLEKKLNTPSVSGFGSCEEYCKWILLAFCFRKEDLRNIAQDSGEAILSSFSIIPGTVNQKYSTPRAYNILDSHPIIQLESDLYFLPFTFGLAQSLYESPFYWMAQDKAYKDISFINRGEATVNIAFDMLVSVFGSGSVYKGAKVQRGRSTISDIDILAVAGNKAFVVQAKSKRLTELARKGNEQQIKNDFEKAIQETYEQGLACRKAILDKDSSLLSEDGSRIRLDESIDDVYIVCLTSDHYPALKFQVNHYLRKKAEDPYPLTVNLFDLDVLTFYLKDPFEFLYYLRQRITFHDYFLAEEEMAFLGYHLKQKLFPAPNTSGTYIDQSMAQLIDAHFPIMRGQHPTLEPTERLHHKWANKKFTDVIEQIKGTRDPGFTDALFYLYDIAGSGADELINAMEETKQKSKRDGKSHDFSMIFEDGKSGVTFISQATGDGRLLERRLVDLCVARKYKTKADIWLGLASIVHSENMIDAVVFNKEAWKFDPEIEAFSRVALKPGTFIVYPKRKVGRNDACPCGSSIKFKKCCGR